MDEPRITMDRLLQERQSPQCQFYSYDKKGLIDPREVYTVCRNQCRSFNHQIQKKDMPIPFKYPTPSDQTLRRLHH